MASLCLPSASINPADDPQKVLKFMGLAIDQAEAALRAGEVPVGCVFVAADGLTVIAAGHNRTNDALDGTQHAEIVAINSAMYPSPSLSHTSREGEREGERTTAVGGLAVFEGATLFVSCEPCIMCAAAIAKLKIKQVYFGCHNERFGGNGSILSVHSDSSMYGHKYDVYAGIMKDEAICTFQKFYESENRRAPDNKRRKKG